MRRVVVTGLGLVTPLGGDVETSWKNILASKSGATRITRFDPSDQVCQIACEVKPPEHEYGFDPGKRVDHKVQRQVDPFIVYGIDAAGQAIEDAGLADLSEEDRYRAGVSIGSGIGGLPGIEKESLVLHEKGPKRVSPHFVHGRLINLVSGQVSIRYGLMGPNHAVVTACSTGAHSIGDAARMISLGDADVMLAGGAESALCPLGIAGFAQARALSTRNDEPERASRPYDVDRDGFVMGEGAGVVVLEEYERAKARGAKIYAELVGYGMSGDAYHVTAPHPEGAGGYRAMEAAMKRSGLDLGDIDYINAHGTSTPLGDELELGAVRRLFGNSIETLSMSSTKSAIGHLLGGAGAVEAIFCILALRDQIVPPTLNLDNPSEGVMGVDLVPHVAKERKVKAVLNNSFGFGGTNASLVMRALDPVKRLLLILAALAVLGGGLVYWSLWASSGPAEGPHTLIVEEGSSLAKVAAQLDKLGAIPGSATSYRAMARIFGSGDPVQAGEFEIPAGASGAEVLDLLQHGQPVQRLITIPEGMPSILVYEKLMGEKLLTGSIAVPQEGPILPDSYSFQRGENRAAVLKRMQDAMTKTLDALWPRKQPHSVVNSKEEAIILASVVEKETGKASERPMVAGVYSNRLRIGMKLDADPTVIYPITKGKPLGRRIRRSELQADNGYNTYARAGLPDGPIANPGKQSIAAVLNPAKTRALYFVADGTGGHVFANTLAEHNANVQKWYAIRRARGEM